MIEERQSRSLRRLPSPLGWCDSRGEVSDSVGCEWLYPFLFFRPDFEQFEHELFFRVSLLVIRVECENRRDYNASAKDYQKNYRSLLLSFEKCLGLQIDCFWLEVLCVPLFHLMVFLDSLVCQC